MLSETNLILGVFFYITLCLCDLIIAEIYGWKQDTRLLFCILGPISFMLIVLYGVGCVLHGAYKDFMARMY